MARDVMTIRLDRTFRSRLQVAAKRRRVTPSAAARVALEVFTVDRRDFEVYRIGKRMTFQIILEGPAGRRGKARRVVRRRRRS